MMNGLELLDFMAMGGTLLFGLLVAIIIAVQGVFTLLKWLKQKDNIPTLIITIGYIFGAFSILLSSLIIEIAILGELSTVEEMISIGFILFVIFGTISSAVVLGGMIWDFIKTKSEVKSE